MHDGNDHYDQSLGDIDSFSGFNSLQQFVRNTTNKMNNAMISFQKDYNSLHGQDDMMTCVSDALHDDNCEKKHKKI